MKIKIIIRSLLVIFALIIPALSITVQADEFQESTKEKQLNNKAVNDELDTRMPAVVPGEEVMRGGRKMKVWSSGGSPSEPVVDIQAPQAPQAAQTADQWNAQSNQNPGDVSVVIDGRGVIPHRRR